MALTWVTDWRNKARFTKKDRQRSCLIASVSPNWRGQEGSLPLVFAETHLIGTGPVYLEVDGVASSPSWNADIRAWARDNRYDIMPDGERFVVWESPDHRQKSYAINMALPAVAVDFIEQLLEAFPWAHGWHADYYTNLAWLAEEYGKPYTNDAEFWAKWDLGLVAAAEACTGLGKLIVAQQFHLTRATPPVNGLFLEVRPNAFGMTLADHERDQKTLAQNGKPSVWCMEIRYPEYHDTNTLTLWRKWAEVNGIYEAIGRDAAALGT